VKTIHIVTSALLVFAASLSAGQAMAQTRAQPVQASKPAPAKLAIKPAQQGTFDAAQADVERMKTSKDTLSAQSEQDQLKMQMVMDRMTKADSAASNTMKKSSDTASAIIGNTK
jgi:hypothetical protein